MINEEYRLQIKISEERDEFISVAGVGVKLLVRVIEANVDSHFSTMLRLPWTTWENVGDQSMYVTSIESVLQTTAKVISKNLSGVKYYKMYCEKFAGIL